LRTTIIPWLFFLSPCSFCSFLAQPL
jgi:hypothetical protein